MDDRTSIYEENAKSYLRFQVITRVLFFLLVMVVVIVISIYC